MKIKEICEAERPRERMLSAGPSALGNSELLAILLRTGTRGDSAVELAQKLLSKCEGRLSSLFNMSADTIRRMPGIGPCKAATIQAALELGRRFLQEESAFSKKSVTSPRMVYDLMIPLLKGAMFEQCWALFLNAHNYVVSRQMLTKGGSSSTVMDVGQVIRSAMEKGVSGLILVHNHPSGSPVPSKADLKQTEALHKACKAVQISLLDHVIISDGSYFSCADDRMYNVSK